MKITGKIKAATLSGAAWNAAFYGQTFTSGSLLWNIDEADVIPATPYTVTVTNAATFDADLGVRYAVGNLPLQRTTAGLEAAGLYSVTQTGANKGKYVFAVADTALGINITYTSTQAGGQSLKVTNQLIGTAPTFKLDYYTNLNQPTSKPFAIRVFSCVGSKFSLATKLEDFILPEIDFSAMDDGNGNIYEYIFPEIS